MEIQKAIEWVKAISATQSNSLNKNSLADRKEPFGDWCSKCGQSIDWNE